MGHDIRPPIGAIYLKNKLNLSIYYLMVKVVLATTNSYMGLNLCKILTLSRKIFWDK